MFLKSLQIKGFKSFADGATLGLEPGVTVVVGPNGSGKSNVVDAIGWVLGAQAPSAVRSQKMDDVIFAGSARRPALGRAEVSLTIDNGDGLLPIEFAEVTLSRVLFRSGESEYSINGVPCRLLDIQELLSDAGVGRQQHVIISQGQIDAVLNAKPEDRRLVIEEAAGILKFRRRKEKAERRLASTEAHLTRLQDLLREVRRQLRPLERQADAARRHGAVLAELVTLRTHLAGRDLARFRAQLAESSAAQGDLRSRERDLRAELARLDAEVLADEARLSAEGGHQFGDALARYEALRERARGLLAVLAERARGVARSRDAFVDAAVVASLEAEVAQVAAELAEARQAEAGLVPDQEELAEARARAAEQRRREEVEPAAGDGPAGELARTRAELAALRAAGEAGRGDRARLEEQLASWAAAAARVDADLVRLGADDADLAGQRERAAAAAAEVADRRDRADVEAAAADARAQDLAADHQRWTARAEALALALDDARRRAGADHLAGLDGVVGTLLDVIEIDDGWAPAVEAALAEALAAVVVDDPRTARQALSSLAAGGLDGAVIALGGERRAPAPPPAGVSVRAHVSSTRPGVDALVDRLLASAVCVEGEWGQALDVAVAHPGLIVVTPRGDRFGPNGWVLGAAAGVATGAALEEARVRAEASASELAVAAAAAETARAAAGAAAGAVAAAERACHEVETRAHATSEALVRARREAEELAGHRATLEAHIAGLAARLEEEAARIGELEALEADLVRAASEHETRAAARSEAVRQLEAEEQALETRARELEVRRSALVERRRVLEDRQGQLEARLHRHEAERAAAGRRRAELDERESAIRALEGFVAGRRDRIDVVADRLRAARRRQSERAREVMDHLEALRRRRAEAERELEEVREHLRRAELADTETNLRLEATTETLRAELDCDPERAIATECPLLPDGVSAPARVRELERDLRLMGPINPLALEEFEALTERHEFLQGQLDDIRQTRRELAKVIRQVDDEIVGIFSSAFADVADHFAALFETLFPGGQGALRLSEPHDLLNTGIEIEARPSGKNVKKLSLLSGGERSLTALAYLFAVFRSRPSPFYVMDEVEAALDDVNLHRFLGLVAEFRAEAQLLIVSHQKRTMEAADVLYGVTMEPGGSSRVLSERVAAVLD